MQVGACLHVTDLTQNLCLNSIFIVTPHKMVSWGKPRPKSGASPGVVFTPLANSDRAAREGF